MDMPAITCCLVLIGAAFVPAQSTDKVIFGVLLVS